MSNSHFGHLCDLVLPGEQNLFVKLLLLTYQWQRHCILLFIGIHIAYWLSHWNFQKDIIIPFLRISKVIQSNHDSLGISKKLLQGMINHDFHKTIEIWCFSIIYHVSKCWWLLQKNSISSNSISRKLVQPFIICLWI